MKYTVNPNSVSIGFMYKLRHWMTGCVYAKFAENNWRINRVLHSMD